MNETIKNRRLFRIEATSERDAETLVVIDIDLSLGSVRMEMSNLLLCENPEEYFEESVLMAPEQFKVFAAACKALADTL